MDLSKTVFVSDLDGTLLTSDKRISARDLEAIKRYKALGGRFVIASGRPLHTVVDFIDALGDDFPMILCNGGVIYDPALKKTLYEIDLPDSAAEIIRDIRENFVGISPEIYTFSKRYYFHMNTVEKWHQHILGIDFIKVEKPGDINEPWNKMLFADEVEVIDRLTEYVKKFSGEGVRFVRSFPKFLEVLPEGVSKGSALSKLKEICGLEGCFIAAAGDYDNDVEMLKASDYGFCPSNSEPCVKSAAGCVLKNTCDTGAVSEALEILEKM